MSATKIRWKGKILGPFSRREIDRKMQEHDLGMLHEIWSGGNWITLKEFLGPKEIPSPRPSKDGNLPEEDLSQNSPAPRALPPPVWLLSGYLAVFVLLFHAMLGWTHTWTISGGWAPLFGLGLGLVGGLFGLLTFFQGEKNHGITIVTASILLAFANMMFT